MKQWQHVYELKDILKTYNPKGNKKQEVNRIKESLHNRLEETPLIKHFQETLKGVKTEKSLNKWLDTLYDHCDFWGIWLN